MAWIPSCFGDKISLQCSSFGPGFDLNIESGLGLSVAAFVHDLSDFKVQWDNDVRANSYETLIGFHPYLSFNTNVSIGCYFPYMDPLDAQGHRPLCTHFCTLLNGDHCFTVCLRINTLRWISVMALVCQLVSIINTGIWLWFQSVSFCPLSTLEGGIWSWLQCASLCPLSIPKGRIWSYIQSRVSACCHMLDLGVIV